MNGEAIHSVPGSLAAGSATEDAALDREALRRCHTAGGWEPGINGCARCGLPRSRHPYVPTLLETVDALRRLLPIGARIDLQLPPGPESLRAVVEAGGTRYDTCRGGVTDECARLHLGRISVWAHAPRKATEAERAAFETAPAQRPGCVLVGS